MKIAMILGCFPSLSETFILSQITGLLDRGHEVDVYAYNSDWAKVHPDVERYKLRERVRYSVTPANKLVRLCRAGAALFGHGWSSPGPTLDSLNPLRHGRRALNLSRLFDIMPYLERRRYDVVHCHFGPRGLRGTMLKTLGLIDAPLVTAFYGFDVTRYPKTFGKDCYLSLFAENERVLVLSEQMKERVTELGCPPEKVAIHRLGVDVGRFAFQPRSHPGGDGPVRVVTVARMVEKKGLEYAIRAFARVAQRNSRVEYTIAGDGALRPELEALIAELGMEKRITLLGWQTQDQICSLYDAAHVFMLPSVTASDGDEEGTPTAIVEVLAMGLPVLSTHHSGIPEQVQDGVSGYLVPERDVDALAERLAYLIEHPERWPEMGRAGRRHVEEHYDINKLNDRLVDIYRDLLKKPVAQADATKEPPLEAASITP